MSKTHTFKVMPWPVTQTDSSEPRYCHLTTGKLQLTIPVESVGDFIGELEVTIRRVPSKRERKLKAIDDLLAFVAKKGSVPSDAEALLAELGAIDKEEGQ
jgi:hypothetical protein